MPIGYIRGKSYVTDRNYDRWGDLDCFKRLHQRAGVLGFGCKMSFSYAARRYCAEPFKLETFKHSAQRYFTTLGHKYGENPLEASLRAYRQCLPFDALMWAIMLECEAQLLKEAVDRARKIESVIEQTERILELTAAMFMTGEIVPFVEPRSADPSDVADLDDDL